MTAVLAIIGRFCVNITFNIGLQYGAELIPTSVRAQGIVSFVHHHFLSMSSTKLTMIKVSLYFATGLCPYCRLRGRHRLALHRRSRKFKKIQNFFHRELFLFILFDI